jgi:hypothetical protein
MSFTEERAIYLAFELDRSWTEMTGVNPLDGTNYLDTASAFTIVRVKSKSLRVMIAQLTDFRALLAILETESRVGWGLRIGRIPAPAVSAGGSSRVTCFLLAQNPAGTNAGYLEGVEDRCFISTTRAAKRGSE